MEFSPDALDRHITGNYGEDQFPPEDLATMFDRIQEAISEAGVELGEWAADHMFDRDLGELRLLAKTAADSCHTAVVLLRVAKSRIAEEIGEEQEPDEMGGGSP